MASTTITGPRMQCNRGLREKSDGLGSELDYPLISYLQGVICIHHPTVCPGGHNQEPSGEKSKEAGNILKKIPHLSEQTVWKGHMGSCQPWAHAGGWNAASLLCFWFLGVLKILLFSFSLLPAAGVLTNRL